MKTSGEQSGRGIAEAVSGLLLAGGLGRRMGGVDKGLQLLQGRPLAAWVAERLRPQVDELLISANRHAEDYAALGGRVLPDLLPDFAGPLAGLQAGLTAATHPLLLTAPCDSPYLPDDLVFRLFQALTVKDALVAVARGPERLHPVFSLCRRAALPHLTRYLEGGGRRVAQWYLDLPHVEVMFPSEAAFANFNTVEALAEGAAPV